MAPALTLTAWLRRDHQTFRALMERMEAARGGTAETDLLKRLLPLLAAHERVERELLYPAILEHVKPLDPRLIDAFADEHAQVREKIEALRAALADGDAVLGRLVAVAEFVGLLREHLEDEEQTLFPLVESRVPVAVLFELAARAEKAATAGHPAGRGR